MKKSMHMHDEESQTVFNTPINLNTHEKINSLYSGDIEKIEKGYARVSLETHEIMCVDDAGLVHGGFIFSAANYAAMAAVNESNGVLASGNCLFLAPVKIGDIVVFEAKERQKEGRKRDVLVYGFVLDTKVFEGEFKTVVTERHVLRLDLMKHIGTFNG